MTEREFINCILPSDYDVLSIICNCFTYEELEAVVDDYGFGLETMDDYLLYLILNRLQEIESLGSDIFDFVSIGDLSFDYEGYSANFDEYFEDDEEVLENKDNIFKQIEELFKELNKWK